MSEVTLGPTVRLATVVSFGAMSPERFVEHLGSRSRLPAILVSYAYSKDFMAHKHRFYFRDWVLDSGAFSAHHRGWDIKLQDYIDFCKEHLAHDSTLTEVFALDVIGSWQGSMQNTEAMWQQGVPAIPCFHHGEPWDVLTGLARDYPKVAIGGCVGLKSKVKNDFAQQCFARVWPKKLHGFGFGSETAVLLLPWHSVDATNWESGPTRFGNWQTYGKFSIRGSHQNLRAEIDWYLDLEQRAQRRWRKQMMELQAVVDSPKIRLAYEAGRFGLQQAGSPL